MSRYISVLMSMLALGTTLPAQELTEVAIVSSLDQVKQPAFVYLPDVAESPVPILVVLHSWSGDYKQKGNVEVALQECHKRGWGLIHPNFRGPNWTPEACGSKYAVQDVVDAVAWMKSKLPVDEKRIYLTGASGGGHMSLLMAGKHPEIWAGVSAWVGISDLRAWHSETKIAGRNYYQNIEKAVGGPPGASAAVDTELQQRSPLTWLGQAQKLPIDIQAGIHDGHSGSVPISHSLRAFNLLAEANGHPRQIVSVEEIEVMTKTEMVPAGLRFKGLQEERKHDILFRRQAGPVRVTLFEGGHEGDLTAAIYWLAEQSR